MGEWPSRRSAKPATSAIGYNQMSENRIVELCGISRARSREDFERAIRERICPFARGKCSNAKKSNRDSAPEICSVRYRKNDVIVCPKRFLERNQIFIDCLYLFSSREPSDELYLVPDVKTPGGTVDYFLIAARNGKIVDFLGIDLRTIDAKGSLCRERRSFLEERGLPNDERELGGSESSFGLKWKTTLKKILVQLHRKGETFEKLNKRLVLVVQKPLYKRMKRILQSESVEGVRIDDPIQIHSYDFAETESGTRLKWDDRISATSDDIARCLKLSEQNKQSLDELLSFVKRELTDERRLDITR